MLNGHSVDSQSMELRRGMGTPARDLFFSARLFLLSLFILLVSCLGTQETRPPSGRLLILEIQTGTAKTYDCRLVKLPTDSAYEVEDEMLLNPFQNPFASLQKEYRLEFAVNDGSEVRVPVSSRESIHILCEEDRFFRAQSHAFRINIESENQKPACESVASRFLSSKTHCSLPVVPPDAEDQLYLTLNLSRGISQEEPVRSCASPFQGLDNHPAREPLVHESMVPRITLAQRVLLSGD